MKSADSGYSYQLIDTNDNATLQDVLTNGNVADKGFVLTNLADDAILVSPEASSHYGWRCWRKCCT